MNLNRDIYDVIIIGGGACGLMAATEISRTPLRTALLEAKDRLGGRIHTIRDPAFSSKIELGAEFIHGKLPLTNKILGDRNISVLKTEGEMWSYFNGSFHQEDLFEKGDEIKKIYKSLPHDLSVAEFVERYFQDGKNNETAESILTYVEGYHAAHPAKASSLALLKDFFSGEEEDYRIPGGYQNLIEILHDKAKEDGVEFYLSQPVTEINTEEEFIQVHTTTSSFKTKKLIVTISLGCLQNETIQFTPALPFITIAARNLGFGSVIKIVAEFQDQFWKNAHGKDLSKLSFVFSEENIPTWWTQYPEQSNMITGWLAGQQAIKYINYSNDAFIEMAIQSLSVIFNKPVNYLNEILKTFRVANWATDPFVSGAYAYEVVNGDRHKKVLMTAVQERIFFAGEALQEGSETGTVEAALSSGKEVARKLLEKSKENRKI